VPDTSPLVEPPDFVLDDVVFALGAGVWQEPGGARLTVSGGRAAVLDALLTFEEWPEDTASDGTRHRRADPAGPCEVLYRSTSPELWGVAERDMDRLRSKLAT
jgi:hypothetical protein